MAKVRLVLALALLTAACSRSPTPVAVRLVDLYKATSLASSATGSVGPVPRTEWRFDGPAGEAEAPLPVTRGWNSAGVRGLAVREGRLEGVATTAVPLLHVERKPDASDHDPIHEVQVRLRVSAGTTLSLDWSESEKVDLEKEAKGAAELPWRLSSPLVPGPEAKTYGIKAPWGMGAWRPGA